MVDKMHRDWKWRAGVSLAVALGSVATWAGMAFIAVMGLWTQCGFEWSPEPDSARSAICGSDALGVGSIAVLGLAALAIASVGIAWVVHGRGGRPYLWSLAGGLAVALAIPLTLSAFPAS